MPRRYSEHGMSDLYLAYHDGLVDGVCEAQSVDLFREPQPATMTSTRLAD